MGWPASSVNADRSVAFIVDALSRSPGSPTLTFATFRPGCDPAEPDAW